MKNKISVRGKPSHKQRRPLGIYRGLRPGWARILKSCEEDNNNNKVIVCSYYSIIKGIG